MSWDDTLAADAQAYALQLANTGEFKHSKTTDGENLYKGYGNKRQGFETAAFLWYGINDDYKLTDKYKIRQSSYFKKENILPV